MHWSFCVLLIGSRCTVIFSFLNVVYVFGFLLGLNLNGISWPTCFISFIIWRSSHFFSSLNTSFLDANHIAALYNRMLPFVYVLSGNVSYYNLRLYDSFKGQIILASQWLLSSLGFNSWMLDILHAVHSCHYKWELSFLTFYQKCKLNVHKCAE